MTVRHHLFWNSAKPGMKQANFASKLCGIDDPVPDAYAVSSDALFIVGSKLVSGTLFMFSVCIKLVVLFNSKVNTSANRIRNRANH